jgi:hypothetical protein
MERIWELAELICEMVVSLLGFVLVGCALSIVGLGLARLF